MILNDLSKFRIAAWENLVGIPGNWSDDIEKSFNFWKIKLPWLGFPAIHGFTISIPVLVLLIFWRLLLRDGKTSSKCLFWNDQTQRTVADDNSKLTSKALYTNVVLISFELVLYLEATAISNQIKYYLKTNKRNFLETQYGCYRYALQITMPYRWKSIYQKLKKAVNVWNIIVKDHSLLLCGCSSIQVSFFFFWQEELH